MDTTLRDVRFEAARSAAEAIGRKCAAKLKCDVQDGEQLALRELFTILDKCPTARWEKHIEKRITARLMARRSPLRKCPPAYTRAGAIEVDADAVETTTPEQQLIAREIAVSKRLQAQRDFEKQTKLALGEWADASRVPGEFGTDEDSSGKRAYHWPGRPGCDPRIVDAVVPYLVACKLTPPAIRKAMLQGALDRPERAGTLRGELEMVRVARTWLESLPPPVPDGRRARATRIKRVEEAARALGGMAADPVIIGRLMQRHRKDRLVELLRWAGRLAAEAHISRREPAGRPGKDDFRGLVRRLRRLKDRRGRPLSDLSIAKAVYVLELDGRPPKTLESAVRDARRVGSRGGGSRPKKAELPPS
jgi:hypothetical protein